MKNLEIQEHLSTELEGGAPSGHDGGDKPSTGKKVGAKRRKGQQAGTAKKAK